LPLRGASCLSPATLRSHRDRPKQRKPTIAPVLISCLLFRRLLWR
jgi:hypothetical protein